MDLVAAAIRSTLTSPDRMDSQLQPANVVDEIGCVADALRAGLTSDTPDLVPDGTPLNVVHAIFELASQVGRVADALAKAAES